VINPGVNLSGGVKIGDQNLFGTNATITQYLNIGDRNSFSAASFISKNIENNQILIGNPARVIGLNNYK
jgi:UDP-3-O-[3-hydroxymyristoyl] glucosamine N-acyltransferase